MNTQTQIEILTEWRGQIMQNRDNYVRHSNAPDPQRIRRVSKANRQIDTLGGTIHDLEQLQSIVQDLKIIRPLLEYMQGSILSHLSCDDRSADDVKHYFAPMKRIVDLANTENTPLNEEEKQLIKAGGFPNHLKAVRSYRSRTNCGLVAARRVIEQYHDQLPQHP